MSRLAIRHPAVDRPDFALQIRVHDKTLGQDESSESAISTGCRRRSRYERRTVPASPADRTGADRLRLLRLIVISGSLLQPLIQSHRCPSCGPRARPTVDQTSGHAHGRARRSALPKSAPAKNSEPEAETVERPAEEGELVHLPQVHSIGRRFRRGVHDADQAIAPGKLLGNLLCSVAGLLETADPFRAYEPCSTGDALLQPEYADPTEKRKQRLTNRKSNQPQGRQSSPHSAATARSSLYTASADTVDPLRSDLQPAPTRDATGVARLTPCRDVLGDEWHYRGVRSRM